MQEVAQPVAAARMAQAVQSLALNLANTFARQAKLTAYFFKRVIVTILQTETQPKDARLHNLRGELLMAMRRFDDALASYASASKEQPGWPQPYRGQATALIAAGQPARILQDGTIELVTASSVERPDDINCLLVNAGTPPTLLMVEEEELEQYFLRLVGMDGEAQHA